MDVDGRRIIVSAVRGELTEQLIVKTVGSSDQIEEVTVDGHPGLWFAGAPHHVMYDAPIGDVVVERVAADTLVWQDGDSLFRVEGFDRLADAHRVRRRNLTVTAVSDGYVTTHRSPIRSPPRGARSSRSSSCSGSPRRRRPVVGPSARSTPCPRPNAGQTVEVGFTILQHGVTPADLSEDVGIEIIRSDGSVDFFAGTSDGDGRALRREGAVPRHRRGVHVGRAHGMVRHPGPRHDRGAAERHGSAGSGPSAWSAARWVMVVATLALATIAVADLVATRRRARPIPS